MLKRCQVLLLDWQEEYLKEAAKRHDLSFSEGVRIFLSTGMLQIITALHPQYEAKLNKKEINRAIRKATHHQTPRDEQYKLIARLYFEARKASEYRLAQLARKNGNGKKRQR